MSELGFRPIPSFLDRHRILSGFLWSSEWQLEELLVCMSDGQCPIDDDGSIDTVPTSPKHSNVTTTEKSTSTATPSPCTAPYHVRHYRHYDNSHTDQVVVTEMESCRHRRPLLDKLDPATSLCITTRTILRRIAQACASLPPYQRLRAP
ncbi:hypothetical protein BJY52DRAFT_1193715 [Lactarius psammicola]|nr:hypothetical protein BJY52DRAFT_1193715 [Lactarius psammicola]